MADPLDIQSEYRQALYQARLSGLTIGRQNEARIRAAFAEMLRALTSDVEDGTITPARAKALREQTIKLLSRFEEAAASAVDDSVRLTAAEVAAVHRRTVETLFTRAGLREPFGPVGRALDVVPSQAVAALLSRHQNAATFRTVLRRRLALVVPEIDGFVASSVARGIGVGRAALDLATILANEDADLIARLPRSLSSSLHRGVGQVDLSRYGLSPDEVRRTRGVLYDARRIQVSETNNALREANTRSLNVSPTVEAARWQRSGRHHVADACDALATLDLYGYGPGIFPVDAWPFAPHPMCSCVQGGPVVARPVREWNKPRGPGRPLSVDPGQDDLYDAWKDDWTLAERRRVRANVSAVVLAADLARAKSLAVS